MRSPLWGERVFPGFQLGFFLLEQGHFIFIVFLSKVTFFTSFTRVLSEDGQRVQGPASEMVWYVTQVIMIIMVIMVIMIIMVRILNPLFFRDIQKYRNTLLNLNVMFSFLGSLHIYSLSSHLFQANRLHPYIFTPRIRWKTTFLDESLE